MEVTPELAKDISELIKDPKLEVKKGVLGILLQTGNQENNRKQLQECDLIKYFFRYMTENTLETSSLTNLINFSQDKFYIDQILQCNGVDKIFEYLKEIMDEVEKSESKQFSEQQQLIIQLCVLLLLNISKDTDAQDSFFQLQQEKEKQGRNILYLLKMLQIHKDFFKYFPNILANLSSNEKCREILLESVYQIIETLLPMILDQNRIIRIGSLKTLRNCIFEYEKPLVQQRIISPQLQFVDILIENQINLLQTTKFYESQIPQEYKTSLKNNFPDPKFQSQAKSIQQEVEELYLTVDILLVLSNIDQTTTDVPYDRNRLKYVLQVLKCIRKDEQEYQDQLDVIEATYQ